MVRVTKNSTQYATAMSVCRTVEATLLDKKEVLTVSTMINDYYGINGVCLSMPAVVGAKGVEKVGKSRDTLRIIPKTGEMSLLSL